MSLNLPFCWNERPSRRSHGEKVQMRPLLRFLREAYAEHIKGMDREYGPWLNKYGVR
jgi:hemerythrin